MSKISWIILAFISGTFLPLQAGLNTRLGKSIGSPVYASAISFITGAIGLILYILLTRQTVSLAGLKAAPVCVWLGGMLGAFYVTVMVLAFPKLGPGLSFGLVVAGQMTLSALLEHYNILVAQPHPMSYLCLPGILLVIAGVIIIQKF